MGGPVTAHFEINPRPLIWINSPERDLSHSCRQDGQYPPRSSFLGTPMSPTGVLFQHICLIVHSHRRMAQCLSAPHYWEVGSANAIFGQSRGAGFILGMATMKSLCLASLLTIAVVQQAVAVVPSPPKIGQPQGEPVYYYYHGRHYPYRYHGHYFNHRAWHAGHWRYY